MADPRELLEKVEAKDVAFSLPVDIKPSDLATRARKVARETGYPTLPVVEDRIFEGVLRAKDLLEITSTQSNIKVTGLMTSPVFTAMPDYGLIKIAEKSIELNLDMTPVVESSTDKTFLGVVRLKDILKGIRNAFGDNPKVREIMTEDVATTRPEEKMSKVWSKMEEAGFSGIPVVKEGGKPVAMITRSDILKSGRARLAVESKKGRMPPKVETIMQTPVVTVPPDSCISEAVEIMMERNIGRLPVTENGKLVGIVDREDTIKPYCR